jgi:hypothetical protein
MRIPGGVYQNLWEMQNSLAKELHPDLESELGTESVKEEVTFEKN